MNRPFITDHALVRYMERVLGVDVEAVRDAMNEPGLQEAVEMGARKVRIGGVAFFCQNKRVTTIWNSEKHGAAANGNGNKAFKRKPNQKRLSHGSKRSKKRARS